MPAEAEITTLDVNSGPFEPGTVQTIATNGVTNVGDTADAIYFELARLDADGNVMERLCKSFTYMEPGETMSLHHDAGTGDCNPSGPSVNPDLRVRIPDASVAYYGFKAWGINEDEPSYPAPGTSTAAAASISIGESGELAPIDGEQAAVGGVVGAGVLGAAAHEFILR